LQEKAWTKQLVKDGKLKDEDGSKFLLYPDTVKQAKWYASKRHEAKKQELKAQASAEKKLYQALFKALDYSGAFQDRVPVSSCPAPRGRSVDLCRCCLLSHSLFFSYSNRGR